MRAQPLEYGLPDKNAAYSIVRQLEVAKKAYNLQDIDISYLRKAIDKIRTTDLEIGSLCGFWDQACNLADELGIPVKRLQRIEKRLLRKNLINVSSFENGRRIGQRNEWDKIRFLAGIDLSPLFNKASQIQRKAREFHIENSDRKELRNEVNCLIKQIRTLGNDAVEAMLSIDKRLRPSEIQSLERLRKLLEAFQTIYDEFCCTSGRTDQALPSDISARPSTLSTKPINKSRITPEQAKLLASDELAEYINFYAYEKLDWGAIITAAYQHGQVSGLNSKIWHQRISELGEIKTAICWIVADRNSRRSPDDPYHIKNPCGAFVQLAKKEAREQGLMLVLLAELQRFLSKEEAS